MSEKDKEVGEHAEQQACSRKELARETVGGKLAFNEAQSAKVLRGLDDANAGRFASDERIAEVLNRHRPK